MIRRHPDYFYDHHIFEYLINKAVLEIDSAGISPRKISCGLLIWRTAFEGGRGKEDDQPFGLFAKA